MKISKIYSNKQFKNVEFSFGLNVVIGKISEDEICLKLSDKSDDEKLFTIGF